MRQVNGNRLSILAFAAVLLFAVSASADIAGTNHDFSGQPFSGGEICVVCHAPHFAPGGTADAPLWNHEVTVATFAVYASSSLDATVGQPGGVSKLCLSCHDGTVAIDSFAGMTGTQFIGAGARVGTDLTDDHPVSFAYDAALVAADGELVDPAVGASGLGGTINDDLLFGGLLECASCHDVHGAGFANFLVKSNAASALCLTCHDK
jgi:predicted CXXCH cytochrome family protein